MEIADLGTNLSLVRDHLSLFSLLLFALPLTSFLGIKFWIAARASKVQRSTNWFVPTDLDSEAARLHYSMGRQSTGFTQRRNLRHSVIQQDVRTKKI